MKQFLQNMSLKARVAFCSAMVGLVSVGQAVAQTTDPITQQIMEQSTSGLQGMVPQIVRILKIIVVIGGAISFLVVIFNIIQGERDAAKKAGWWLVGLALGFTALSILGNITVS